MEAKKDAKSLFGARFSKKPKKLAESFFGVSRSKEPKKPQKLI
jgi:hypothetical protein